jgi:hypothetical protein
MADTEENGASSAEQAFDHLRAQVMVMRQALEALPRELQKHRPVDTTETLGQLVQALRGVGDKLGAIEQHPAMRLTPAQYQAAIVKAGDGLIHNAVQKLERATDEAVRERQALAQMIGSMDGQRRQLQHLLWAGCGALLLGLLMSPVFAALLPFGWDGQVVAYQAALALCRDAAAKAKKEQHCLVVVPAP